MKLFTKDKLFYKTFFSMTGAIALQNLITFAVNLADNIMIGGYSQTALSGVSMVKELQPIRKATSIGVLLGIILSAVMMVLVFFSRRRLWDC